MVSSGMDSAWDRERKREIRASEFTEADCGRVFGCAGPKCRADLIGAAIPHATNRQPMRPRHFRTKIGPHNDCPFADPAVANIRGSATARRSDGPPSPAPGRVDFSRIQTVSGASVPADGPTAARKRSVARPGGSSDVKDHVRTCTTITPVCEFLRTDPHRLDEPLRLPHLGQVTYGDAFGHIPFRSTRKRGWRIWRGWLPFRQSVRMSDRRIRIEVSVGMRRRRSVLVDCDGWPDGLSDRLLAKIRNHLGAVEAAWENNTKLGCELFVFAPEPSGTGAFHVAHPGMICLLLGGSGHTATGPPTVAFSDQRASSRPARWIAETASTTSGSPGQR